MIIRGQLSYNVPSDYPLGDGRKESFAPAAFRSALDDPTHDIRMVYRGECIARTGSNLHVQDTPTGLVFAADLSPDDPAALLAIVKIRSGLLTGFSTSLKLAKTRAIAQTQDGEQIAVVEADAVGELLQIRLVGFPVYETAATLEVVS